MHPTWQFLFFLTPCGSSKYEYAVVLYVVWKTDNPKNVIVFDDDWLLNSQQLSSQPQHHLNHSVTVRECSQFNFSRTGEPSQMLDIGSCKNTQTIRAFGCVWLEILIMLYSEEIIEKLCINIQHLGSISWIFCFEQLF